VLGVHWAHARQALLEKSVKLAGPLVDPPKVKEGIFEREPVRRNTPAPVGLGRSQSRSESRSLGRSSSERVLCVLFVL
jgi:hypothetical protein